MKLGQYALELSAAVDEKKGPTLKLMIITGLKYQKGGQSMSLTGKSKIRR